MVRHLILASTTAYRDGAATGSVWRLSGAGCRCATKIAWDDPALTGVAAPDGALSRAMAHAGAPRDIWHLDRLEDWHRVLAQVRFSSDWNAPHAAGQFRPATPDNAEGVLRNWAGPVLILHGSREMTFPMSLARKLHSALPSSTLAEIPDAAHVSLRPKTPKRGSEPSAASSTQRGDRRAPTRPSHAPIGVDGVGDRSLVRSVASRYYRSRLSTFPGKVVPAGQVRNST